jgi:hypothetical protein
MLTIRIPTLKYLPQVVTELEQLNFNGDIDLTITVDRWSDELEMADASESNISKIHNLINSAGAATYQMEQLRQHLRGA